MKPPRAVSADLRSTTRALLLRGGEVLTAAGALERADVLIADGRITAVAADIESPDAEILDASDAILAPGLINSHYHSGESLNPGLYENLPLDLWFLHSHQVTRTEPMTPDAIYARTLLGAVLQLEAGTTTVVDFLFEAPEITLETLEPVVRAYRDVGMRATVLLGVADLPFLVSLPIGVAERAAAAAEAPPPPLERIARLAEDAVARWHDPDGLVQIGLGPSAPQRCSDELLQITMQLARRHGLVWQTHVLETRTQAVTTREWHDGRTFIEVLADQGLLGPEAALAHAIWLTDRDRELLARHDTAAVHCPYSNLRLGDGIADVAALREAGVRVALGTDGRGCHESLSLLEVARLAALLGKVHGRAPERWPTALDAFDMATRAGSRCAGHGDLLGRLEVGARADLVLLDRSSPTFAPLHEPVRQLLFGSRSGDVRSVLVDGRVVVRDGRAVGVDTASLLEDCARHAAEELAVTGTPRPELEAVVRGVFDRAEAAPLDVGYYAGGA